MRHILFIGVKMKISIRNLEPKLEQLKPLAEAYYHSYNNLSKDYKSSEEMALYTKGYFLRKLWKMSHDKESAVAVLWVNERPGGFVRYSKVPDYYKTPVNGANSNLEQGVLDGYDYTWVRKVDFNQDIILNDKTLIVNQIYLDPALQHRGLGTYLFAKTLPTLKENGYESLIIEYNENNKNAEKFYKGVGFSPIAKTKDFDHIIEKDNKTLFCVSDVEIAYTTVDDSIKCIQNTRKKYPHIAFLGQKNVAAYR